MFLLNPYELILLSNSCTSVQAYVHFCSFLKTPDALLHWMQNLSV